MLRRAALLQQHLVSAIRAAACSQGAATPTTAAPWFQHQALFSTQAPPLKDTSHVPTLGTYHTEPMFQTDPDLDPETIQEGYAKSWKEFDGAKVPDPFTLVHEEVRVISERLRNSVASSVPSLKQAAEYFFQPGVEGKRLRPTLAMLMASALAPDAPDAKFLKVDTSPANEHAPDLRRRQQRLAEITELIHVASLLHDDVLDDANTRRGIMSVNLNFGNKTAILAGDFLLARASVSLASLQNNETVRLMSQVLEHLVTGEIMQMTASPEQLMSVDFYMQKTFCKTASLLANSCRSIAVLSGQPQKVCDIAEGYGRHLGLAFQIVDDILDLTASSSVLGKPALNDMKSGLATVPVLYAAEEHFEMKRFIQRRFKGVQDIPQSVSMIERSKGIARARELAQHHCILAAEMVRRLPAPKSEHATICRAGLIKVTQKVLLRSK